MRDHRDTIVWIAIAVCLAIVVWAEYKSTHMPVDLHIQEIA